MTKEYEHPVRTMSTGNLVVALRKLEKDISHFKPGYRKEILDEAATRLSTYRAKEMHTGAS